MSRFPAVRADIISRDVLNSTSWTCSVLGAYSGRIQVAAQCGVLIVPIRTVDCARPTRGDIRYTPTAVPASTFIVSRRDRILLHLLPIAWLLLSTSRVAASASQSHAHAYSRFRSPSP